jgi:5'-deoxynucleotidase YfbR-like HD superfamily hydrolase
MKIALQYVSDEAGKTKSVQVSLTDWEKLLMRLKKYEQALKVKTDLTEAFEEVEHLRRSKKKKQTLNGFLDEL